MNNIIITAYNEQYECAKAIKGEDFIYLYDEDNYRFMSFEGIKSFDGYFISGGDWSIPDPTETEYLRADIDFLTMENESLEEQNEQQQADIDFLLMMIEE